MMDTNSQDLGIASIPALHQYLQLAYEQELNVDKALAFAGIDTQVLADNSQHITGKQFQTLIAELIAESQDDLFGLHTAKFVQPGSYSVLGFISMNCDTLGQAINKIIPFERIVGDMGSSTTEQVGDDFKISWHCSFTNLRVRRHMIDNVLASWVTFARYLTDSDIKAKQITLTRNTPDQTQQKEYQQQFGCPVRYHQGENSIYFDSALLKLPLNKGDQKLLHILESHAESLVSQIPKKSDVVEQVLSQIRQNLASGKFRQQDIAEAMGIGGKTLQRRLMKNNTSFQQLLDQTRLTLAKQHLKQANSNIDQLTTSLGFAEPRSFFRWFKNLTKQTPSDYKSSQISQ